MENKFLERVGQLQAELKAPKGRPTSLADTNTAPVRTFGCGEAPAPEAPIGTDGGRRADELRGPLLRLCHRHPEGYGWG